MQILYHDEDIVVVEKPSGLLSVPGRLPENKDSVVLRLSELGPAHAVHRLDMATSGLMLVAKNKASLKLLNEQFANRTVSKGYLAVVDGLVEQDFMEIKTPIRCDWPNRPRQEIHPSGKASHTLLEVESRNESSCCSVVRLTPVTGRSHQLRIHMQSIGHSILGCEFYAPDTVRNRSNTLLLHAQTLAFTHPTSRALYQFYSIPAAIEDFRINAQQADDLKTEGP